MILITSILTFAILSSLGLGITVFQTNRARKVNQSYLITSICILLWLLANLLILHSKTSEQAKLYINVATALAATLASTFQLLRLSIKFPANAWHILLKRCSIQLILNILIVAVCFLPSFTKSVQLPAPGATSGLAQPEYGIPFIFFLLYMLGSLCVLGFNLFRDRALLQGTQRLELEFLVFACVSGASVGVLGTVFAFISKTSTAVPISNAACVFTISLIVAYGISVHKILTVSALLRKATAYALITAFLCVVYYITWIASQGLCHVLSISSTLPSQLIATLAVAFSVLPARRSMRRATDFLFSNAAAFDVQETLKNAGTIFQSVTTIDALLNKFSELLTDSLDAAEVSILISNSDVYLQNFPKTGVDEAKSFSSTDSIVQMIRTTQEPVGKDRLIRTRSTPEIEAAIKQIDQYNVSIASGIFSKRELSGLVLLGSKRGGGIYDKTEQDTLQILCNQFAVALDNANLYTEMQDSKIRNDILLDQLVSGVIVANPQRQITMINHEAQRIIGMKEGALLGQNINLLPGAIEKALADTLENHEGARNMDGSLFAQEEESTSIRMGPAYLMGHDDKPMGALLVFTDMTELKGLEEQVRRSDQLSSVGTLAAGMAHEIKNPLDTIKTFTQLLPQRYADEEFRQDFSSLVAHEVSRIDGIVNQLLSFSKPTKPHLMPMNLHGAIEQVLKLMNEQLTQKHISLDTRLDAASDKILGDESLLFQALINLHLNAIDAIEQDGSILVSTTNCAYRFAQTTGESALKQCIRFQISDSGKGIDKESLQKIFDPFFTSKSEGTGMGLSVSHGIIQEHHGVVEVESELGKGTTFYIYIPLLQEDVS